MSAESTTMLTTPASLLEALHAIQDPELFLSIVDMGLIRDITVDDDRKAVITMTLTTEHCPAGEEILANVQRVTHSFPDIHDVEVRLVWQPPWSPEMMTPELKRSLGIEQPVEDPQPLEEEPPPPPPTRQPRKKNFLQRLLGA